MQKLAELHPHADTPKVDVFETTLVHISPEVLVEVLMGLRRGSGAGPSRWTYERLRAACAGSGRWFDATLQFANHIAVSGRASREFEEFPPGGPFQSHSLPTRFLKNLRCLYPVISDTSDQNSCISTASNHFSSFHLMFIRRSWSAQNRGD